MKNLALKDLPEALREHLLWEMDLQYDSYESSMAECIHGIMNGSRDLRRNEQNINNFLLALSEESLANHVKNVSEHLGRNIGNLENFKSFYNLS